MQADPASLNRMHDIAVPPPVSWWPPAPGWYFILGAFVIVMVVILTRAWLRHRADAYRRAALAELDRLPARAESLTRIAEILKRTALAVYSRTEVAELSGSRWIEWLNRTTGKETFTGESARLLGDAVYATRETSPADMEELLGRSRAWIRAHSASLDHSIRRRRFEC